MFGGEQGSGRRWQWAGLGDAINLFGLFCGRQGLWSPNLFATRHGLSGGGEGTVRSNWSMVVLGRG